jgi:hypothetical protein
MVWDIRSVTLLEIFTEQHWLVLDIYNVILVCDIYRAVSLGLVYLQCKPGLRYKLSSIPWSGKFTMSLWSDILAM